MYDPTESSLPRPSTTDGRKPITIEDHRSFDRTCTNCGTNYIGKSTAPCPSCQGRSAKVNSEVTQKTFGAGDHDLLK